MRYSSSSFLYIYSINNAVQCKTKFISAYILIPHYYDYYIFFFPMIFDFFFCILFLREKTKQHRIKCWLIFFFFFMYISCLLLAFLLVCVWVYTCNLFIYLLQKKRKRNLSFFFECIIYKTKKTKQGHHLKSVIASLFLFFIRNQKSLWLGMKQVKIKHHHRFILNTAGWGSI